MVSPVLQERVTKAAAAMKVDEQYVWAGLDALGIGKEDEDALSVLEAETTREGDARRIFVDQEIVINATATPGNGISVKPARFLMGWAILKGKDGKQLLCEDKPQQQVVLAHPKTIRELGDRELIQRFRDEPDTTPVINELAKRSEDRPFVVYDEDNKVNVDHTMTMLRHARRGETKATAIIDGGKGAAQVNLYRASETPMTRMEVCPVHPDTILVDGCCDECHNSWKQVPMEVRQIVRVAVDKKTVNVSCQADIHELIAFCIIGPDRLMQIPAVAHAVKELQKDDAMPRLIKRVGGAGVSMKVERRY